MRRESKDIPEHKAPSDKAIASVARSFGEANSRFQALAVESVGRAVEIQSQLIGKAYETYLSEMSKLGRMQSQLLVGYYPDGRQRRWPSAPSKELRDQTTGVRAIDGKQYDHEILLLQGGGALGAYQAGVYEGLVEAGVAPTWVVGISIGAINAALIVGNPPERRIERLREFWGRVSRVAVPTVPAWLNALRPTVNYLAAMEAATFGIPCFYTPRMPPAWLAAEGTEDSRSVYDTTPLKETLEELVDFDLINSGQVRLSLGAVDIRKGTSVYFDTKSTHIHSDHVRASGALPPGFPPVMIDGEHYWDGGVVTNTPISYVSDERPLKTARIIQVDVFNAQGEIPRNLDNVSERAKDIQYASRTRLNIEQIEEIGQLVAACRRLVGKLPPELKSDPDAIKLAAACDERSWTIIRLINTRPSRSGSVKDNDFSRATIEEAWAGGLEDVRRSLSGWGKLRPEEVPGILIYRPTEVLPSPGQVAMQKKAKSEATRQS